MRKPYVKGWITCDELESSVTKVNGCWEWKYSLQRGNYGMIRRHGKGWAAHRVSYFMFKTDADLAVLTDSTIFICHHCDNSLCINPDHLFMGNVQANKNDSMLKRRHNFGEKVWKSSLHEKDIIKIFRLYANGMSIGDLGRRFNISYSGIKFVLNRTNWKHVAIPTKLLTKMELLNATK